MKTVIIAYYIFALIVIGMFGYAVFILKESGWWFLLCAALISYTPTSKKDNNN